MTDVINLNKHRKAKHRAEKEQKASENRRKFGRTKAEKQQEQLASSKQIRHIEGHKRDNDAESDPS